MSTQRKAPLRQIPNSLSSEQVILGSLLAGGEHTSILEGLTEHDFYLTSHRILFKSIHYLVNTERPADVVTVGQYLHRRDVLDKAGGVKYLRELVTNLPSDTLWQSSKTVLQQKTVQRQLVLGGHALAERCYAPDGSDARQLLEAAEVMLFNIRQNQHAEANVKSVVDMLSTAAERLQAGAEGKPMINGITTGFRGLDNKLVALEGGDFIIVAARPSMGKTTFAMNIVEHVMMTYDQPVVVFSVEMPSEQIMMRLLSSMGHVDGTDLRQGRLDDESWSSCANAMAMLKERDNLLIDDASELTPSDMRLHLRKIIRTKGKPSLVMVDYLQLMHSEEKKKNRTEEVGAISKALKEMAKEFNVPVIALSQLNRSLENRQDKRPINSDLRDSGNIEQDADVILFIYRDEVYHENTEYPGLAEVSIGKQRNGPTGTVMLTFQGQFSRFENIA